MKNAITFFYNFYITELKKINNNYYFSYQNNNYVVAFFDRNLIEIDEIYKLNVEMINLGVPVFKIIITKENKILMNFENKYYILMQFPNIKNRLVTFEDVLFFNIYLNSSFRTIDKSSWNLSWQNKIDYIENQFSQLMHKYPLIKESINYYIGIWENSISYYNNNIDKTYDIKVVCHKRITCNMDLLEFYNPLNIIIDYKERDIADYLKSYIYEKNWTRQNLYHLLGQIDNINLTRFISRILFPSNYFDLYEDIILEIKKEKEIEKVIQKREIYEKFLKYIYLYYENYNIPMIDWIIKKE